MYQNGKFQIEEKKMIKARVGFSPDEADGLALTFGLAELKAGSIGRLQTAENRRDMAMGRALSDYDPLQEIEKSSIYSEVEMPQRDMTEDLEMPVVEVI